MFVQLATSIEFDDINGRTRTIHGCSIDGAEEFDDRLNELNRLRDTLEPGTKISDLYRDNKRFRFLVDRCLKLNGIKPKWVSFEMMVQLLFGVPATDTTPAQLGYLLQINGYEPKPAFSPPTDPNAKPLTRADKVAILASHVGLTEALRLARDEPARPLFQVLHAIHESRKTPEQRQDEEFKDWANKASANRRGG